MKKILLLGLCFFAAKTASTQVYFSDDFSSENLNSWTLHDEDGDGNNWEVNDYGTAEGYVATSASWIQSGALTPDNWMVSEMIDLTSASGDINLEWTAKAQDQDWADENYSVYVNTSDDISVMEADGSEFNEIVGTTNDEYVARSVDLSSFAGEEIYVAFRHHDVSDQFRININNIVVRTPPQNDLAVESVEVDNGLTGDREFTITILNNGLDAQSEFDLEWEFGSESGSDNPTGLNLQTGQTHTITVNINDVAAGQNQPFIAEITTADDDMTNNILTVPFNFQVPVPQYTATSSTGEPFDLHERLESGQAILLDYMASWCGPCESSTPEISQWVEENGSGEGKIEALAISIEQSDDDNVLNNLGWHGGFYEYPKFAYQQVNVNQFIHYNNNHGINPGGSSIPFFVLLCPNVDEPENSEVIEGQPGFAPNMFLGAYNNALNNCPTATLDVVEIFDFESHINLYPNPTSDRFTLEFETFSNEDVTVEIVNSIGQTVSSQNVNSNGFQSLEIQTSDFEAGIYNVVISTSNNRVSKRLSIVK